MKTIYLLTYPDGSSVAYRSFNKLQKEFHRFIFEEMLTSNKWKNVKAVDEQTVLGDYCIDKNTDNWERNDIYWEIIDYKGWWNK